MIKHLIICLFLSPLFSLTAVAQNNVAPQYENDLLRFAEILGSLHYLTNLCSEKSNEWRDRMTTLVEAEKPSPNRQARLYAAFNDAYRAFSENYHQCTPSALSAYQRYIEEGKKLSRELINRYGN